MQSVHTYKAFQFGAQARPFQLALVNAHTTKGFNVKNPYPRTQSITCKATIPSVDAKQKPTTQQQQWHPASLALNGLPGASSLLFFSLSTAGLLGSGFDISGPTSSLAALAVLGLTVGIHECGHFTAARAQGIHVTKFAIGFGPNIFSFEREGVEYCLKLLPLGGFVAFPDDDPDSPYDEDDPDLLTNRPIKDRILVVTAGVIANMILAYTICVTQAATVGIPSAIYAPGVKLGEIPAGTIADKAGLRAGDIILRIGDVTLPPSSTSVDSFVSIVRDNPGKELKLDVLRGGKTLPTLSVVPVGRADNGGGRIGVSLQANAEYNRVRATNPVQAVTLGTKQCGEMVGRIVNGLVQLVSNFKQSASQLSGPVKIIAVGAEVARTDASGLFQFAALININLAVVNILPLPALDGGYLVFLILEAIRGGKKVDEVVQKSIMASGLLLLMTTGVALIAKDVTSMTLGRL